MGVAYSQFMRIHLTALLSKQKTRYNMYNLLTFVETRRNNVVHLTAKLVVSIVW